MQEALKRYEEKRMDLTLQTRVKLKKPHPCGNREFIITRIGMDVKLRCTQCGHELMLPRRRAEAAIREILGKETEE